MQVAHIKDKMRGHLRWFGQVLCRPTDALVHRCKTIAGEGVKMGWDRRCENGMG